MKKQITLAHSTPGRCWLGCWSDEDEGYLPLPYSHKCHADVVTKYMAYHNPDYDIVLPATNCQ